MVVVWVKRSQSRFIGVSRGRYRASRAGPNCRAHALVWRALAHIALCIAVHCRSVMAHTKQTTIPIHPLAPAKVAVGAACNGCGVCCLFAPCPLGMLLSHRRRGACNALRWDAGLLQYRCGAIVAPREVLTLSLPYVLRSLAPVLAPVLRRVGLRWIAAGMGCDSNLELEESDPPVAHADVADVASTTMPVSDLHTLKSCRTAVHRPPT